MKAYVDDIIVTDASGEKAVLYPRTKQEAVAGLMERLGKLEAPHIIETEATTMENSYAGRLEVVEIGGGVTEQETTTGAQLFDGALEQGSFDGVLNKIESAYRVRNSVNRPVAPNKTYTIFSSVAKEASIFELDSEGNFLSILSSFASLPLTFTTSSNGHYIALVLRISDTTAITPNMVNDVMLNEGTEALPWEPYSGGAPSPSPSYPQEIKKTVISEIRTHGKNFLKNNLTSRTDNGITLTKNDDGIITVNGTATATVEISLNSTFMPDKDSEYILSGCPSGGSADTYSLRYYEWSGGWKQLFRNNDYGNGVILRHTDEAVNFATRIVIVNGTTVSNLVFKPMIRKIDVENDTYEPYTESTITLSQPIELYGIGAVQDAIEDGKVKRRFNKVIINSDNKIVTLEPSVLTNTTRFRLTTKKELGVNLGGLSTHFAYKNSYNDDSAHWYVYDSYLYFFMPNGIATSIVELNAWLDEGNTLEFVYKIKEEAEELPIADQIALNSLSTYDGITYAEVVSDIPPTFKGKYGTSEVGGMVLEGKLAGLNGELYGISNADRIAALEASVVNNI